MLSCFSVADVPMQSISFSLCSWVSLLCAFFFIRCPTLLRTSQGSRLFGPLVQPG